MNEKRDPNVSRDVDPTWLGPDYPAKTPAELAQENQRFGERVRSVADRWGSPWLVMPIGIGLLVALWELLFRRGSPCPKPTPKK